MSCTLMHYTVHVIYHLVLLFFSSGVASIYCLLLNSRFDWIPIVHWLSVADNGMNSLLFKLDAGLAIKHFQRFPVTTFLKERNWEYCRFSWHYYLSKWLSVGSSLIVSSGVLSQTLCSCHYPIQQISYVKHYYFGDCCFYISIILTWPNWVTDACSYEIVILFLKLIVFCVLDSNISRTLKRHVYVSVSAVGMIRKQRTATTLLGHLCKARKWPWLFATFSCRLCVFILIKDNRLR